MSSTNFLLAIEDLTVSFDGFKVIDKLTLYIDNDELRVIIGPNGAGKTTLLDLICGKTRATGGSIKFHNKEMIGLAEHQIVHAGIGRKFQTPSVFENLTVLENLELAFPRGRSPWGAMAFHRDSEVEDRIRVVSRQIFLEEMLSMEAANLSHGQKQWLEIGILLMQNPSLLMLDEPVAGMSPAEREKTAILLNTICKDRSIIIIEHDMEFVQQIARKVTVLHLGKLLAEGTMQEIQANAKVQEVYLGH